MKYNILCAILIAPLLLIACEKDDNSSNSDSSGKLYVRSLYSLVSGSVSIDWYYMANNGDFVKNPKNGVQPVDMKAEKQNNLQYTGTYKTYQSKGSPFIKITWSSGDSTVMGLKYENNDIVQMDILGTMIRQNGLPSNYKFNGKYVGASTDMTFDFTSGGAFTYKEYNMDTYTWETYTGKYEISGNNLKLTFDQGGVVLHCLVAVLEDGNIIINREYYEKN